MHAEQGALIAQPEYCDEYNRYFDLYIIKPGKDKAEAITSCGRYRSAAWSADGKNIIAVHTDKSISQLQILNNKGEKQSVVWQGKENEVIGQPDWSPDGRFIVASIFRPGQGWNIEQFDLNTKQWEMITNDEFIDMQPQYNADGSGIVFSSDRTGVYNIYQYHLYHKEISQLTRVKSGAFNPVMNNEHGTLYYAGYSGNGTDIMALKYVEDLYPDKIQEKHIVKTENKFNVNLTISEIKNYSPWSSLMPRWWEPAIFLSEDQAELGISTSGNDALAIHNYVLSVAFDAKNKWLVGNFAYAYSDRLMAGIRRSTSIISDTNGDFAYAIKEEDAFLVFAFPYTQDKFRWNFLTGVFISKDSEGRRAQGWPQLLDADDNILGLALTFNNSKNYIRSISENDGRSVKAIAESSDVIDSSFTGEIYTLDWREYIPLGGENVLAVRLVEGYGTDNPSLFKLGGENSDFSFLDILNSVGEPLFGQREYSLRGYKEGLPQLRGRRMQLASLEWRFPIALIERGYMTPPVGMNQISGSVFVDTGAVWQDGSSPEKYYTGVGAELHADSNLFYGLNIRIRLGVASGLDDAIGDNRMYFSLGSSF